MAVTSAVVKPIAAPQNEIGYAQAPNYNWWQYQDETTPELQWPQSIAVYDAMRRTDAQVTSVLRAMTLPVRSTPWRIDPNGASDEVTEFVADNLGLPIVGQEPKAPLRQQDRFSWDEHLRQALLMLPYGHMYFEQTYRIDEDGKRARLRKLGPRMPKTIEQIDVAEDGGLVSITQYWTRTDRRPRPIPVNRLVAYIHEREGGNWLGSSILRPGYKNWLLKDRLLRVWAQTIERNGMGVPRYTGAEGEPSLDKGLAMARAWRAGESAGTAIPFGSLLDLVGVNGTLPDAEPAVRYHDEQLGRAVLAHFLNLGTQTGSWALGTTFADFFTLSLQSLAQQVQQTGSLYIIEDLVDINFGPEEPAPRLVCDEIGSRQPATAQSLVALFGAGALTPDARLEESLRQQYGLPPKQDTFLVDQPGDGPAVPVDVEAIEVQARASYPGQKWRHGWIPVGGSKKGAKKKRGRAPDRPASMSDLAAELEGLEPSRQRTHMADLGYSPAEIDDVLGPDRPASMSDLAAELEGLPPAKQRRLLKAMGYTPAEIEELLGRPVRAKFDPGQPRVRGGEHGGEWTLTGLVKDALKLTGRADLEPGEDLVGSDRVKGSMGTVRLAVTSRRGEKALRIGIGDSTFGGREDEDGPWRAASVDVVRENARRQVLRDEYSALADLVEGGAATPAQTARFGVLDDGDDNFAADLVPAGTTARLTGEQARRLRAGLADGLADARQFKADEDARWARHEADLARLRVEADRLEALREPFHTRAFGNGAPLTPAEDVEYGGIHDQWIGLIRQIADLDRNGPVEGRPAPGESYDYHVSSKGTIPGEWADVEYEVFYDDTEVAVSLAAVPHGMTREDLGDGAAQLDDAEGQALVRLLDRSLIAPVQASAYIDAYDDVEPGQFAADTATLLAALADFTGEVWAEADFDESKHLRGPGGKFRTMFGKIQRALADWGNGDGPKDPLGEFTKREPLMDAAKKRGVALKRGATRDEIVRALLDDIREKRAAARGEEAPPKPSHRLTLQSRAYRDLDVGVYQETNGKVSLYREASPFHRGSKVVTVADLAALEQWGRDNGEPQVAEWAAKERGGAPVKKTAPRKAPALKAPLSAVDSDGKPIPVPSKEDRDRALLGDAEYDRRKAAKKAPGRKVAPPDGSSEVGSATTRTEALAAAARLRGARLDEALAAAGIETRYPNAQRKREALVQALWDSPRNHRALRDAPRGDSPVLPPAVDPDAPSAPSTPRKAPAKRAGAVSSVDLPAMASGLGGRDAFADGDRNHLDETQNDLAAGMTPAEAGDRLSERADALAALGPFDSEGRLPPDREDLARRLNMLALKLRLADPGIKEREAADAAGRKRFEEIQTSSRTGFRWGTTRGGGAASDARNRWLQGGDRAEIVQGLRYSADALERDGKAGRLTSDHDMSGVLKHDQATRDRAAVRDAEGLRRLADAIETAEPLKAPAKKAAPAKRVPAIPKAAPKAKREPLGDPAAKLADLRALGDREAVRDDLDLHTVAELRTLATGAGVATSGRKRDIVDRITEALSGGGGVGPKGEAPSVGSNLPPARRAPATPVPIHDLFDADDATIEAALRDVFEGQFGPYATKVRVHISRGGTRKNGNGPERVVPPLIGVSGKIFDDQGAEIGYFGRSVSPIDLVYPDGTRRREIWADHEVVQLGGGDEDENPAKYHGKGFGGAFNRRVIDWYRASGVHGISQNDHNFYVWASQGFGFRGGVVPQQTSEAMRELIADLRAGKTKNRFGEPIPKALREAPDRDAQIAAAEALLARLESTQPGEPGYPTAYEVSQIGRRPGQRGKTATWFGKVIPVPADELILNPDEGEVIS